MVQDIASGGYRGHSTISGATGVTVAQTAVIYAKAALNTASDAADRASDAVAMARRKVESLLAAESFYHSVDFYFWNLRSPIQTAETDGDGKFTIQVPRTGDCVIAAQAQRRLWKETEKYYWIQPVSREGQQQLVLNLSNNNLISSLIPAAD